MRFPKRTPANELSGAPIWTRKNRRVKLGPRAGRMCKKDKHSLARTLDEDGTGRIHFPVATEAMISLQGKWRVQSGVSDWTPAYRRDLRSTRTVDKRKIDFS